jgi:hypothetical protein
VQLCCTFTPDSDAGGAAAGGGGPVAMPPPCAGVELLRSGSQRDQVQISATHLH